MANTNETFDSAGVTRRIPVALFLSPQSASLDWQQHTARIGSDTLIEWWYRRMRRVSGLSTYIIVHSDAQRRSLSDLDLDGAEIVTTTFSSSTRALADLTVREGLDHIALVSLATAFGPVEFVDEMVSTHSASDNDLTRTSGLPAGVAPWVFSRRLLERLSLLSGPGIPSHPALAYKRLRAATSKAASKLLGDVRETTIDAAARYGAAPQEMPVGVMLNSQDEVDIANEVLRLNEDPKGLEALLLWKRVQIRDNAELLASLHFGSPVTSAFAATSGRPRVLYVSNASAYSGAEESLCQLVRKVDPNRFEKHAVVGMPSRFERELESAGARTLTLGDGFFDPTIRNFIAVKNLIEELKPDVVHLNGSDGLPFLWNAVEKKIPIVLHVRNGALLPFKEYAEAATALIAVSRFLRDDVLRYAVESDRVHVVYDEADTEYFRSGVCDKNAARKKFGIADEAKVIVMVARFAQNKRHDLMLDAFQQVREQVPEARLVLKGEVYGEDAYYDRIRKRIDELNSDNSILHIPFVDDIREIHAAADVLVLCSDREGLGRCVVEAMCMGIPPVVTDTGGSHEIVEDGVSGFVVPGGNTSALAQRIIRVLKDPELARSLGKEARRSAERDLSAEISASKVMDIYDCVLSSGPIGRPSPDVTSLRHFSDARLTVASIDKEFLGSF
ncbi:MAG TPA: glycosyltransferase family 4 protein [Pyrinomonadaceae bacterium]|nr:glycosyltransferase family 4 protein [Pyrinomonadaceae bacterium]